MEQMELNIINMYPDILNMYGDIGNLLCIVKRCQWRGIKVNQIISTLGSNVTINEEDTDMIFIGGGSDNQQSIVSENLIEKRNKLENYIENDGVVLAICGSYQMLGNDYLDVNNENIPCLELLDIKTESKPERLIGNILIENNLNLQPKTVVGFENHGGRTYHKYKPFGTVKLGYGNNGQDNEEGIIYKNIIGSYLHGPLLPKNPHIADYLILKALKNKYELDKLPPLNDNIEIKARTSIAKKLIKLHQKKESSKYWKYKKVVKDLKEYKNQ
jgi:CobQ-like glutamine amidotransferase family enzyme